METFQNRFNGGQFFGWSLDTNNSDVEDRPNGQRGYEYGWERGQEQGNNGRRQAREMGQAQQPIGSNKMTFDPVIGGTSSNVLRKQQQQHMTNLEKLQEDYLKLLR